MSITEESPNQPDVIALIGELDAYQDSLYPPRRAMRWIWPR
jgi:putative acetyltransferase